MYHRYTGHYHFIFVTCIHLKTATSSDCIFLITEYNFVRFRFFLFSWLIKTNNQDVITKVVDVCPTGADEGEIYSAGWVLIFGILGCCRIPTFQQSLTTRGGSKSNFRYVIVSLSTCLFPSKNECTVYHRVKINIRIRNVSSDHKILIII